MPQDSPSRKLDQYIVRFPDGMRDRLKAEAARNNRSMNAEIVSRLEDSDKYVDEIVALSDALRETERKIKQMSLDNFEEIVADALPAALFSRIEASANRVGRDVIDEIVAALLEAYPPPPPFSLDQFNEEWIARILEAPEDDRLAMVEEANQVLKDNGGIYEIWLEGPKEGNRSSSVVLARRGAPRTLRFGKAEK